MTYTEIIASLKKKALKPVYWLEGDENFFIDEVIDYAEANLLTEAEKSFNLSVFYGKDADWAAVLNTCRRYPMFGERSVVIIKEAQHFKDLEKLESYIAAPLPSTVLFVALKDKKLDARTKFAKTVKAYAVVGSFKKLYETALPQWLHDQAAAMGLTMTPKAAALMVDHLGNDLSRMANELKKIALNINTKTITEDEIEKYVGISKEYNVFELQDAVSRKDYVKAIRIINYFAGNPKAGPVQLILPSLHGLFTKVQLAQSVNAADGRAVAAAIGVPEWKAKDYVAAAKRYNRAAVEKNLLLLHQYNLRTVGINDGGTTDAQLLQELMVKMFAD